ncbi:MAG: cysteine hydrolase [Acidobacteria bacterium]|nr:cysteine hydrolase [Acidobacteriota bacterium]
MNRLFFLDVDTQRDFMRKDGALHVPGAERIISKLRRLFDFAERSGITVLSSVDAHAPDDPEFGTFPPHCVKGSEGQRKIDETVFGRPLVLENRPIDRNLVEAVRRYPQIVVEKQTLDLFSNPVAERLLRALPPRAVVFGVTTEYCVRAAALGLRARGVSVALVTDAVRALSPQGEREALAEMQAAGVDTVTVDTLLELGAS